MWARYPAVSEHTSNKTFPRGIILSSQWGFDSQNATGKSTLQKVFFKGLLNCIWLRSSLLCNLALAHNLLLQRAGLACLFPSSLYTGPWAVDALISQSICRYFSGLQPHSLTHKFGKDGPIQNQPTLAAWQIDCLQTLRWD